MTPLLRLADIAVAFGGVQAVRGVSFDVRPGEVHALVGENGAGKSTLIRVMTGAIRADRGTVEVGGTAVERPDPTRMRALGIAPIYQQPALLPDLSVLATTQAPLDPERPYMLAPESGVIVPTHDAPQLTGMASSRSRRRCCMAARRRCSRPANSPGRP